MKKFKKFLFNLILLFLFIYYYFCYINKFKKNINIFSKYENYEKKINLNSTCNNFDPINLFNLRLKNYPIQLCNESTTKHICFNSPKGFYNDLLVNNNGLICIMENIILDPLKSKQTGLKYKGPVDPKNKGFPILYKGFLNSNCKYNNSNFSHSLLYESYLNSWNYQYNLDNDNENLEELAPGKTIFLISRNQDSPNIYHGNCEIINAISMLYLFNLSPDEVQVIFLESLELTKDPFYDIYKYIISRGGEPLFIRNLKKKYKISKGIHVPIIWDSTAFTKLNNIKCEYQTKTYKLYNDLVDKYLHIKSFTDSFYSDNEISYYPQKIIKNYEKNITFKKNITIQWRRLWPKGRKGQFRILNNGKQLADRLALGLPNNILVRLINTGELTIQEQISLMRSTDYLVGIHGAGLSLSIFLPNKSILHEITHKPKNHLLTTMSMMSGHITYSNIIKAIITNNDGNENVSFDENEFYECILSHLKENNFFN